MNESTTLGYARFNNCNCFPYLQCSRATVTTPCLFPDSVCVCVTPGENKTPDSARSLSLSCL